MSTVEVEVRPTPEATAAALVDALAALASAVDAPHVGLTGGSMGVAVAQEIGRRWRDGEADFSGVHWWFSDERFVAATDEERNAMQVRQAMGEVPLTAGHLHEVGACPEGERPSRAGAARAAEAYDRALQVVPQQDGLPVLDVVMLGVGPDAHVASLFPGHPDSAATGAWTTAVDDSPKPPPVRVSFTLPVIRSARQVWVVAAGQGKAEAVAIARPLVEDRAAQPVTTELGEVLDVPVSWATGRDLTRWYLDEAAAG